MEGTQPLLEDLALILGIAALTTIVFHKLRQPVVLGYLLTGLLIGPHVPVPFFADQERIHRISELGVVLVMFSVGLEFSLRKLMRVFPRAGITGLIQISIMMWLGFMTGQAFGWSFHESFFAGAIVAFSSTMVVSKVLDENKIKGKLAQLIFGVLVVEDLVAILLLAILTAFAAGADLPANALVKSAMRLFTFLIFLLAIGFLIVPRSIRAVVRLKSSETLLIASIGLCFTFALIAQKVGYSVALGAFIAGSLVAESGEGERVEHLIVPVRDMFAAMFFVSIGMAVNPALILEHWAEILTLTVVVLGGQLFSVSLGSFLGGYDVRTSIQAGMALAQVGEFSFIIAQLGTSRGLIGNFVYPIAVGVSVITTFMTPYLVRYSERAALYLDELLPRPLQTFVTLYGSWWEQIRENNKNQAPRSARQRLVRLIIVDGLIISVILLVTLSIAGPFAPDVMSETGLSLKWLRVVAICSGFALSVPFVMGIGRCASALGAQLTATARDGTSDIAAAPRRAFVLMIQLVVLLLIGIPLLAITQPFLPLGYGAVVLVVILALLGMFFWQRASDLHVHVRAGAEIIVDALARQAKAKEIPSLEALRTVLPGLGDLTPIPITDQSPARGKTLAELNLRGRTGASVVAIRRGENSILVPTGREALKAGDVLALAGTHEAIERARSVLQEGKLV